MIDFFETIRNRKPPVFAVIKDTLLERVQNSITFSMMLIVSIFLSVTIWVIYRPATLTYNNLPFPVVEKTVFVSGDVVPLLINQCSTSLGLNVYSITLGFNNVSTNQVTIINSTKTAIKHGCSKNINYLHKIPKDLPPGTYTAIGTSEIQDIFGIKVVAFESQSFTVK